MVDSAVMMVKTATPIYVTAQDVNDRFGDLPSSIRFNCPYCRRPLVPGAMGPQYDRKRRLNIRGRDNRRTKSPYFSHLKDDKWAQLCEHYHPGSAVEQDNKVPSLLMFLRRDKCGDSRFHIEFSLRRRGLQHMLCELTDTDVVTVDGIGHPMRELLAKRSNTIRLPHPDHAPETRIIIPERWQRNVGRPQPHEDPMVFSSAFGANGGRRLPERSALQTGVDYYIIGSERRVKNLSNYFDFTSSKGVVDDGPLLVYEVRIGASSARLDKANNWLGAFGYFISDYDCSAQLMWPPSLRSWGVDEPLFRRASPAYRAPYQIGDAPMPDRIATRRFLPRDPRARAVSLLGFDDPDITRENDSYCVFFKPTRRMPWSTVYIGPNYPDDLHPYDEWEQAETTPLEPSETIPETTDAAADQYADDRRQHQSSDAFDPEAVPLPLTRGAETARIRLGSQRHPSQARSRSAAIAQLRERI